MVAFGFSFDLEAIINGQRLGAFQSVLGAQAGAALFFEDLFRSQPFDPAATVPDSGGDGSLKPPRGKGPHALSTHALSTHGAARVLTPGDDAVRERSRTHLDRLHHAPTRHTVVTNDRSGRDRKK